MSGDWVVEIKEDGTGVIEHRGVPGFLAHWCSGPIDLSTIEGLFWIDEGAGEEDALTLYAFRWKDAVPGQAEFEALFREAVAAIDHWIGTRL